MADRGQKDRHIEDGDVDIGSEGDYQPSCRQGAGAQGQHPAAEPKDGGGAANQIAPQGDIGDDEGRQEERRIKDGKEVARLVDHHRWRKQPEAYNQGQGQQNGQEAEVDGRT